MPNGSHWYSTNSGVVFVAANGEIVDVYRGTLGKTDRPVDTGNVWRRGEE